MKDLKSFMSSTVVEGKDNGVSDAAKELISKYAGVDVENVKVNSDFDKFDIIVKGSAKLAVIINNNRLGVVMNNGTVYPEFAVKEVIDSIKIQSAFASNVDFCKDFRAMAAAYSDMN